MMLDRRILEALDACRPESEDLHNPEHGELAAAAELARTDAVVQDAVERLEQFDLRMQAALEDVSLPSGLADRVLQGLSNQSAEAALVAVPAATPEAPVTLAPQPIQLPREVPAPARRQWLWNSMVATAAAVLVAAGLWSVVRSGGSPLSKEEFRTLSRNGHDLALQNGSWNTQLAEVPADFRFPEESLLVHPRAFQVVTLAGGRQAVAFDVTVGNHRGTVIVCRGQLPDLDQVPSRKPFVETAGVCIGLWQRDGLLFALVIEGKEADYRQLLMTNQGTLG